MKRFLSLLCLLPCLALAQPASQPDPAQAKYEEAKAHYNLRDYEKALGLFKESYLLSKEPELLLNIAQCYRYLKRNEDAIATLQNFLFSAPDSVYRPEAEKLLIELKGEASGPSSEPAKSMPQSAPASLPAPSEAELRLGRIETRLSFVALGAFTGVTGAAFLNREFDNPALFAGMSAIGGLGGLGVSYLYVDTLHKKKRTPAEAYPLTVGLLLGAGQGVTGARLLNIDKNFGPQGALSATWFSTASGLVGGAIATEIADPGPGDSVLVLSGAAFSTLFAMGVVGAAQLDIEVIEDLAISSFFNAGILGAGAWSWFFGVNPKRVLWVDLAGSLGASAGLVAGGLLEKSLSPTEELPIQGASIGGLLGGAVGLTVGLLVTRRLAPKRPKLQLATPD